MRTNGYWCIIVYLILYITFKEEWKMEGPFGHSIGFERVKSEKEETTM